MQGEQLVGEIARYAADKKAIDVVELDLRGVLGYTDYFLVCSGNTGRQAKAIHDGILEGLKREHDTLPRRVEGSAQGGWILMDYLDVVVHIFTPETREFYRLEQLWGEVPARRERVNSRRHQVLGPVTRGVHAALVVRHDEDDVWPGDFGGAECAGVQPQRQ